MSNYLNLFFKVKLDGELGIKLIFISVNLIKYGKIETFKNIKSKIRHIF